jgi:hypothetical protein
MRTAITIAIVLLTFGIYASDGQGEQPRAAESTARSQSSAGFTLFKIAATQGYDATVSVSKGRAEILLRRGHSAALYTTERSAVSNDFYKAVFPGLGRVAVHFHPRLGGVLKCRGGSFEHRGSFTGRIQFRGERNYTRINSTRANGALVSRFCKIAPTHPVTEAQAVKFKLSSLTVGRHEVVEFLAGLGAIKEIESWESADGIPLGLHALEAAPVTFSAVSLGIRHGVKVVRIAAAGGPRSSFSLTSDRYARVKPSKPFVGSGEMDGCRLSSWRGSLKVRFPGREIRLAGSQSIATLEPPSLGC